MLPPPEAENHIGLVAGRAAEKGAAMTAHVCLLNFPLRVKPMFMITPLGPIIAQTEAGHGVKAYGQTPPGAGMRSLGWFQWPPLPSFGMVIVL